MSGHCAALNAPPDRARDNHEPLAFLRQISAHYRDGRVNLVAIDPNTGFVHGAAFLPDDFAGMDAFIADGREKKRNLYFGVNPCRPPANGKAAKDDIVAMVALHVDIDPDPRAERAAERRRIEAALRAFPLPPSLIIDSGNGFQGVWYLLAPMPAEGNAPELERYNKGLLRAVGGDKSAFNLDRVLRLPGTANYPTATKLRKGYPTLPSQARVVSANPERLYRLADFAEFLTDEDQPARQPPTLRPLGAKWRRLIRSGDASAHGDDKSRLLQAVVAAAVRAGWRDDEIQTTCRDPVNGISAHPLAQSDPARAVQRCIDKARSSLAEEESLPASADLTDFLSDLETGGYLFIPTRSNWPAKSVNATVRPVGERRLKPTAWLDQNAPIHCKTWIPGEQMVIEDRLVSEGGWIPNVGKRTLNLYLPPVLPHGDPAAAQPWLDHLHLIYPDDADHIVRWLAHRVQRAGEKLNHALVLLGEQGIGKDTLLEPVKQAVGPWNFHEVNPLQLLGEFNSFVKSVVLRVSEARDLGDVNRFALYEHMKTLTAAPPDTLRCNEKNLREHAVFNVCGVIITSNHGADGIYLPPGDRRHYVAGTAITKEEFPPGYWQRLYAWYAAGGHGHVAAYLAAHDLTAFDPKAPPRQTRWWHTIVSAGRSTEDEELMEAVEALGNPQALTVGQLREVAPESLSAWMDEKGNQRRIPHRLTAAGYMPVRNPDATNGKWQVRGQRHAIYAQRTLTEREQVAAARVLIEGRLPTMAEARRTTAGRWM